MNGKINGVLGNVVGGAAVMALNQYGTKKIVKGANEKYSAMVSGLALGLLGTYGLNYVPRQFKSAMSGAAHGALGIVGAEMYDMLTKQGSFVHRVANYGYAPAYRHYTAPVSSVRATSALEI